MTWYINVHNMELLHILQDSCIIILYWWCQLLFFTFWSWNLTSHTIGNLVLASSVSHSFSKLSESKNIKRNDIFSGKKTKNYTRKKHQRWLKWFCLLRVLSIPTLYSSSLFSLTSWRADSFLSVDSNYLPCVSWKSISIRLQSLKNHSNMTFFP